MLHEGFCLQIEPFPKEALFPVYHQRVTSNLNPAVGRVEVCGFLRCRARRNDDEWLFPFEELQRGHVRKKRAIHSVAKPRKGENQVPQEILVDRSGKLKMSGQLLDLGLTCIDLIIDRTNDA